MRVPNGVPNVYNSLIPLSSRLREHVVILHQAASKSGLIGEGIIVQLGISQDPPAILKNSAAGKANNENGRVRHIPEPHRTMFGYDGFSPG